MIRRIAAVIAATAMLLVLAVPAMAGGWAEIVADAGTTEPPVEDQPIEVGFKVMQHGVTPAPWETATVHFVDLGTGDRIDVDATNDAADGHFNATATLPHAGYWSWQVTLQNLASEHVPVTLAVRTASGMLPAFDPATAQAAIDRAKSEIRTEIYDRLLPDIDRLGAETRALAAQRDELTARLGAAESTGGLPLLAVISLAVLAGATAGFVMSWLAGRAPGRPAPAAPASAISPASRGADPA